MYWYVITMLTSLVLPGAIPGDNMQSEKLYTVRHFLGAITAEKRIVPMTLDQCNAVRLAGTIVVDTNRATLSGPGDYVVNASAVCLPAVE